MRSAEAAMKDDAPIPEQIPRKRRQLEAAPDVWLASWIAREGVPPSLRAKLETERQRRRALRRTEGRVVTLVVGDEGVTPGQRAAMREACDRAGATDVRHPRDQLVARAAVRESDLVIAGPRESAPPASVQVRDRSWVWLIVDYAKHRSVPVKIIMPNGQEGNLG